MATALLRQKRLKKSVDTSLSRLRCQDDAHRLNTLYCHVPDLTTPLQDQAASLDALYRKGLFKALGVSNFPLDLLKKFVTICKENGYIQPTVYQGLYNVVSRSHEEIFPFLRENGIKFIAHSPVATGFLSGKFSAGNYEGTRFTGNDRTAISLREQWDKKEWHKVIADLDTMLEPIGITSIEAALRWICYHSQLTSTDGIILGATNLQYIHQNTSSIRKGRLPENVVGAMNNLWTTISKS